MQGDGGGGHCDGAAFGLCRYGDAVSFTLEASDWLSLVWLVTLRVFVSQADYRARFLCGGRHRSASVSPPPLWILPVGWRTWSHDADVSDPVKGFADEVLHGHTLIDLP